MWSPHAFAQALPLCVLSLICWGSWSNSAKEAGKRRVPFPHFYQDYAYGILCTVSAAGVLCLHLYGGCTGWLVDRMVLCWGCVRSVSM